MLNLYTPANFEVKVPENQFEDTSNKFNFESEISDAIRYYESNGYVIFSECISESTCEQIKILWEKEIKTYKGMIYRQTTGKPERNIFNKNNWIMNPILNIQSMNPHLFKNFRETVEGKIFLNNKICKILKFILSDKPKLIQSMYFEGNSATKEHQDEYYLGSEKTGQMVAGWLALEEIKADAGRFFILPKSHKLIEMRERNYLSQNYNHYISEINSLLEKKKLEIKAPYLNTGDLLLWNSLTVHGSINSQNENHSRSSITFHVIPVNHKPLYLNNEKVESESEEFENMKIYRDKCQSKIKYKIDLMLRSNFTKSYKFLKKLKNKFAV